MLPLPLDMVLLVGACPLAFAFTSTGFWALPNVVKATLGASVYQGVRTHASMRPQGPCHILV